MYDAEGDVLSKTNLSTHGVTTYTWNGQRQLVAIEFPDHSVTSYRYDPVGRRTEVNAAGVITRYAYDGSNVIAEYDAIIHCSPRM